MASSAYPLIDAYSARITNTAFGQAKWVPLQTFLDDLLPPLPEAIGFDAFLAKIQRQHGPSCQVITKGGRLWGYASRNPSDLERSNAYKYIYTCADRLVKAVPGFAAKNRFVHNPSNLWDKCDRTADTFPDAYLCSSEDDAQQLSWATVMVSGVYASEDTINYAIMNVEKIVQCMANCMMHDPRRRFTYGYTVQDTTMRLWYCDRASIVMSQSFNFITDYSYFMWFLLSCMLADASDLGFDPTMRVHSTLPDGSCQYDIVVRSKDGTTETYRTLDLLFDSGGAVLLGRATRVWKVAKLEHGRQTGRIFALKDSWVEPSIARGFTATGDASPSWTRPSSISRPMAMFLFADVPDCTLPIPRDENDMDVADKAASVQPDGVQVHSRIVYDEIGLPLRRLYSLSEYFAALAQVTQHLKTLHRLGWTHCDISVGNVLLTTSGAKLTDVEFARSLNNPEPYDMIGTEDFKPIEIHMKNYCFMPDNLDDDRLLPAVFYSPLHDLESVWWLASHFVFTRAVTDGDVSEVRRYRRQHQDLADEIFGCGSSRYSLLRDGYYFLSNVKKLHPSVCAAGEHLQESRRALMNAYRSAEQDIYNVDPRAADGIHEILHDYFSTIAAKYAEHDVHMERLSY